jgi:hypothetical protein
MPATSMPCIDYVGVPTHLNQATEILKDLRHKKSANRRMQWPLAVRRSSRRAFTSSGNAMVMGNMIYGSGMSSGYGPPRRHRSTGTVGPSRSRLVFLIRANSGLAAGKRNPGDHFLWATLPAPPTPLPQFSTTFRPRVWSASTKSDLEWLSQPKMKSIQSFTQYNGLYSRFQTKTSPDQPLLLAHYTSVETVERILRNEELWFSNPLYMNDLEEMRAGIGIGSQLFPHYAQHADADSNRISLLIQTFNHYMAHLAAEAALDTYVFCLCEHDPEKS